MSNWTLFSNHGHVLVCLARDPDARLRDVAAAVGITERAVQKIVRDLQESGMISVSKQGRRNQYRIHKRAGLRHELEAGSTIGGLIDFVAGKRKAAPTAKQPPAKKPDVVEVQPPAKKPAETGPVPSSDATGKSSKTPTPDRDTTANDKKANEQAVNEKHREAAATDSAVEDKKSSKAAKEKSEIEKQQGSLF